MFKSNNLKPIVSASLSKKLDSLASETHHIPSAVLMEEAAGKIFARLEKDFDLTNQTIAVIAGTGNNGGDGLAVARYLYFAGYEFDVFLFDGSHYSTENVLQQDILKSYNIPIKKIYEFCKSDKTYSLIIDGIYGIGYNSAKTNETFSEAADKINKSSAVVVSIDVPSGLSKDMSADTTAIAADYTYSVGFHKDVFYQINARRFAGKIINLPISFSLSDTGNEESGQTCLVDLSAVIDQRKTHISDYSHKYAKGTVCVIGGSIGKCGSVSFAGSAAMSVGAGIVSVLSLSECVSEIAAINPTLVCDSIASLDKYPAHYDTFLIGPGLDFPSEICTLLKQRFSQMQNVVLDASFFAQFSPDDLKSFQTPPILTPHVGEFCRFFNVSKETLCAKTTEVLRETSKQYKAYFLLKSATQYLALPDGTIYIIDNPNAIASQAGSGDILAGIIAGYLSLGCSCVDSILCGVKLFYHNLNILSANGQLSYNTAEFIDSLRKISF